jgi:hypothetical protein
VTGSGARNFPDTYVSEEDKLTLNALPYFTELTPAPAADCAQTF